VAKLVSLPELKFSLLAKPYLDGDRLKWSLPSIFQLFKKMLDYYHSKQFATLAFTSPSEVWYGTFYN